MFTVTRSALFSLCLFSCLALSAQTTLDGLWRGTLTVGGIKSTQGYPFEVYLERDGRTVTGRSYLHLGEGQVVEMHLSGRMYDDLSIYIDEVEFINDDGDSYEPPFLRKYQLAWRRGIYEGSLNGYWQEIRTTDLMEESRERGRIFLRKVIAKKA